MSKETVPGSLLNRTGLYRHTVLALTGSVIWLVGFVILAYAVEAEKSLEVDVSVLTAIHATSSLAQDIIWQMLTQFGGIIAALLVSSLLVVWMYRHGQRRNAAVMALGVGGAAILNTLLKLSFARERPELWQQLVTETAYSFPSGHAMASMSLVVAVLIIFWGTKWRVRILAAGVMYVILIGYSRLYLGVHYPTDILAGWAISIAWVLLVAVGVRHVLRGGSHELPDTSSKEGE